MRSIWTLAIAIACSASPAPERADVGALPPPPPRPAPAAEANLDAPSIYDLPIRLRDTNDREIGLDVARGQHVVISMFYASCAVACPALLEDIRRTLAELPADRRDVRVVLVSFDPARDTPERLRELATARGLDARWTLASASDAHVRELAAVLGIKYRKLDNGEFFHSSTITVLDPEGRPIARANAFGQREPLLAALR